MKLSAKTEYACVAVLELAASYDTGEPIRVREIAETHDIPQRFLVQILLQLKGAGLVVSTRGASGGYQLAQRPEEITLLDVIGVLEGPLHPGGSLTGHTPVAGTLNAVWQELAQAQQVILDEITLADLVERVHGQADNMYYI